MKAIIKFKLPEEQDKFDMFNQASSMYSVICEMNDWLRKQTKYNADNLSEDTYEAFIECREKLIELLNENNIDLWK